jgi:hypothetical protein
VGAHEPQWVIDCFQSKSDWIYGTLGAMAADIRNVVAFFEGRDCVDVQDDILNNLFRRWLADAHSDSTNLDRRRKTDTATVRVILSQSD